MRATTFTAALLANLGLLSSVSEALRETAFGQFPDDCPSLCSVTGPSPSNWTQIHRLRDLSRCSNQTVIFDINLQSHIATADPDNESLITIRACVSTGHEEYAAPPLQQRSDDNTVSSPLTVSGNCGAKADKINLQPRTGGWGGRRSVSGPPAAVRDLAAAARSSSQRLHDQRGRPMRPEHSFCQVDWQRRRGRPVRRSPDPETQRSGGHQEVPRSGIQSLEVCDANSTAAFTVGLFAASLQDFAVAQEALSKWSDGSCLDGLEPSHDKLDVCVLVPFISDGNNTTTGNSTNTWSTSSPSSIKGRGTCRAIEVVSGDSCASLASRCGISGNDFTEFNPNPKLCSTLAVKKHVCCSAGTLPDFEPRPSADGTCFAYTVRAGDGCWSIADSHYLKTDDLAKFNDKKTWGWAGCSQLQVGQVICLSTGEAAMPAPIPDAVCGPQKPGTQRPPKGTSLADLNPCPLNACCDIWGFCGTTAEFCTETPADTGNPGTTKPGKASCISNCGMDIVNNGEGPSSFGTLGYFESWNIKSRPCLNMDASQIDASKYSHLHFAFATLTPDLQVSIAGMEDQFEKFLKLGGSVKKIVSFGGWAFSTEPATFQRFRDATQPGNRERFASAVVDFMNEVRLHAE
ncbi:Uncharacterized protein TPAR_02064 [Tolypocladium paradoxum]|uniref:Uncharacterized protein n=1 Tax=Tolypocladium paradoxum TaxID=94208 RepID=A0A2S4L5L7_9HYPO|nr:Uncharacterized protein TPAR_02064 [Tolypocladium paradoxum]